MLESHECNFQVHPARVAQPDQQKRGRRPLQLLGLLSLDGWLLPRAVRLTSLVVADHGLLQGLDDM